MFRTVYILVILFCIQLSVVGQDNKTDALLGEALEIMEAQPEKAIDLANDAFKFARKSNDSYGMILSKSVIGDIGMQMHDYEASYINFSDALEYLEKSDTVDLYNKISILNNLATIKSIYGDHEGSSELYDLAHKTAMQYVSQYREMAEEYGDLGLLVDLPYDMAVELKKDGQYMKAGEILVELWEESEFKNDTVLLAKVVNELGLIKLKNEEYAVAQEFFAVAAFGQGVDPSLRAVAMHNLANTYMGQKDFVKAEKYLTNALELKKEHSNEYSQFVTLLDMGELAYLQDDVSLAISKWESALSFYSDISDYPDLFIVYDWLQKAYKETDLEKAVAYGEQYTSNIRNWMAVQNDQKNDSPTLQAFNSRIDAILTDRTQRAERLALLKRYWPFAVAGLLIIMLFVYMVQLALNKRREQVLERNLRADRAMLADEILDKIRRD